MKPNYYITSVNISFQRYFLVGLWFLLFPFLIQESKANPDAEKVLRTQLNALLEQNKPNENTDYAALILKAQATNNQELVAKAYLLVLKNQKNINDELLKNEAFMQGKNAALASKDSLIIANYDLEIGKTYVRTNKYFLSIITLNEGLTYVNPKKNLLLSLQIQYELALANCKILNIGEARDFFKTIITITENKLPNNTLNALSYAGLAETYFIEQNYNNAGIFYKKAYSIIESIENEEDEKFKIKDCLAKVQYNLGSFLEAKQYFLNIYSFYKAQKNIEKAYLTLLYLSACEHKLNNAKGFKAIKDSIKNFQLNYPELEKNFETEKIYIAYLIADGKFLEAIQLLNKKTDEQLKEVIDIQINRNKIISIQNQILRRETQSELQKKTEEFNLSKLDFIKQQNIILLIGILVLIASLSAVSIYLKKQKVLNANLQAKNEIIAEQVSILNHSNLRLEEAIQQKVDIIGVVSHDLKSPVNRLKGLLELAKIDGLKAGEYHQLMSLCITDVEQLIQNLLDNSILNDGKSKLKLDFFSLLDLLKQLIESYSLASTYKNIRIQLSSTELDDLEMFSDRHLISRIIENILSNAIKFSPRFSIITVELGKFNNDEDRFFISILDEGPGFTTEDREKLFKPYMKLSAIPTSGESSTGLGLSIASKLVQMLKGDILLESEPGNGAKFIIVLPKIYIE